jgi:hypothetical protein
MSSTRGWDISWAMRLMSLWSRSVAMAVKTRRRAVTSISSWCIAVAT